MLRRKYDTGELFGQIGGGILVDAVYLYLLLILCIQNLGGLISLFTEKFHLQTKKILIESDHLVLFGGAKRVAAAKKPDALEQVGLSLRVLAVDDIDILTRKNSIIF